MRTLIIAGGLGLLLAVAAVVYFLGLFEPGAHTDYALEKQLHKAEGSGIIWNAIPIEQAYQAVGRQRTPFRPDQAQGSRDEADYLIALFALTDAALAERVALQLRLQAGAPPDATLSNDPPISNYPAILASLKGLATPKHLVPLEALIYQAIDAQQRYMTQWWAAGYGITLNPRDPLVEESHGHLSDARARLRAAFPNETAENQRAFESHLAALDFL